MFTRSCVFAVPVEHLLNQHQVLHRKEAIRSVRRRVTNFAQRHGWPLTEISSEVCFLGVAPTPEAAQAIANHLAVGENGLLG